MRTIGHVAYELELPSELEAVHLVFHVSILRKFLSDLSRVAPIGDIQVTEDQSYDKLPVAILDRQVRKLRTRELTSVMVIWRNKSK